MTTGFWDEINHWSIDLFEKVGINYRPVGIFWEKEASREEAFDTFSDFVMMLPPHMAVEDAAEHEDDPRRSYELRLCQGKRVVSTILWDGTVMTECVRDYRERTLVKYKVVVEVTLDEDIDPEAFSIDDLFESSDAEITSIERVL